MLTELTIKVLTSQDPEELDTKIREALMGIADISEIVHEEVDRFPNDETRLCFEVIEKNKEQFTGITTTAELEARVWKLNRTLFKLADGPDGWDEGIEWVCFDELFIELKKEKWFTEAGNGAL